MDIKENINPAYIEAYNAIKEREDNPQSGKPLVLFLPHGRGAGADSFAAFSTIQMIENESQKIQAVPSGDAGTVRDLVNRCSHTLVVCIDENDLESRWETFEWAIDELGLWKCYHFERGHREIERIKGSEGSGSVLNKIVFTTVSPKDFVWIKNKQGDGRYNVYLPNLIEDYNVRDFSRLIIGETSRFGAPEAWQVFHSLPSLHIAIFDYHPDIHKQHWLNSEAEMWGPSYKGPIPGDIEGLVVKASYLTMPRDWIGEDFFVCADHIKKEYPDIYRHEFLGEPIKD